MKIADLIVVVVSVMTGLLAGVSIAANEAPPPGAAASGPAGQPPAPPPEAIAACKGKSEGATVNFTGRSGEALSGVCQLAGSVLAARPAGGVGAGRPPPPRQ